MSIPVVMLVPGGVTAQQLRALWQAPCRIELDAGAWPAVEASATAVREFVERGAPAYGINTGFGKLASTHIASGQLEALLLPRKFQGGGMTPAAPLPQANSMLGEQLQNLPAQNPSAITEIIRPQPVFANGQQRGYRVYPGRNRQQFSKLGLMPGDLVTAITRTSASTGSSSAKRWRRFASPSASARRNEAMRSSPASSAAGKASRSGQGGNAMRQLADSISSAWLTGMVMPAGAHPRPASALRIPSR